MGRANDQGISEWINHKTKKDQRKKKKKSSFIKDSSVEKGTKYTCLLDDVTEEGAQVSSFNKYNKQN